MCIRDRYLSRESLPYEEVAFDVWEDFYSEQGWMVQRLEKFQMDLKAVSYTHLDVYKRQELKNLKKWWMKKLRRNL